MSQQEKRDFTELAKSINQFDIHYQRSDDGRVRRYWDSQGNNIRKDLMKLSEEEKKELGKSLETEQSNYFGL